MMTSFVFILVLLGREASNALYSGRGSPAAASLGAPGALVIKADISSANFFLPIIFSATVREMGVRVYSRASSMPLRSICWKAAS